MTKILPIVLQPHPALSRVAEPAAGATAPVLEILENMLATLYRADGVGLAAPQVNVGQRLVVMDIGTEGPEGKRDFAVKVPRFFINPEVIWKSEDVVTRQEGCLSLPGLWGDVERPAQVKVRFTDRDGQVVTETMDGLAGVCIQHEIDHLNGVIFVQRMSKLRKEMALKKWTKLRKEILEDGSTFEALTHDHGLLPLKERM